MNRDIRETLLFKEAENLYSGIRRPGGGQISDAMEVNSCPEGLHAVFAGTLVDSLEGALPTRVCRVDLASGDCRVMTFGPNSDRLPKYSPDGGQVAFLSDRRKAGDFQLYLLDPVSGSARPTSPVEGWVEYLHWSPDGRRILLGVAGHGADISGGQGAVTSKRSTSEVCSWMPEVQSGDEDCRWRSAWIYELATGNARKVSEAGANIWEAAWCGSEAFAAVVSSGPGESLWYTARLQIVDIDSGRGRNVYEPKDQLGWPAASPSGRYLAVVESPCSDRWIVAGELRLVDTASGELRRVDTRAVDVTSAEWRSDRHLVLAGHRGFESVVGVYDVSADAFVEVWTSTEISAGWPFMTVSGIGQSGDCVLVGESYVKAPEVAVIREGRYHCVKSFDLGYGNYACHIEKVECVSWSATDNLEIQGLLLLPRGEKPHPVIMYIHGGPVWHWRPLWLGRAGGAAVLMLIKRGYAVFCPNPRGSTARGTDFIRHVLGDMGGLDAQDCLRGLDYLVERGIADPRRLGITGGSYGGFMSAWLITQDSRFAAAVPVAPVTNQVTEHLMSNIPHFVKTFLNDQYTTADGKYFQRSPIMHAHKVTTPTLSVCGALDRCTPPAEAIQFHSALRENGAESVLVTYPEEGHGIRKLPAAIDLAARIVGWFEQHITLGGRG